MKIIIATTCFLWLTLQFNYVISQQQAVAYYVDQNGQVVENVQQVPYISGSIQPQADVPVAAPALPPPNGIGSGFAPPGSRRSRLFPNGFRFDSDTMKRLGDTIGKFLSGFLGANRGESLNLDQFRNFIPRRGQGGAADPVRPRGRGRIRGNRRGNRIAFEPNADIPVGLEPGPNPGEAPFDPIPPVISSSLDSPPELDYFEDNRYMPVDGNPPVGRPQGRPRSSPETHLPSSHGSERSAGSKGHSETKTEQLAQRSVPSQRDQRVPDKSVSQVRQDQRVYRPRASSLSRPRVLSSDQIRQPQARVPNPRQNSTQFRPVQARNTQINSGGRPQLRTPVDSFQGQQLFTKRERPPLPRPRIQNSQLLN